jgi:hypothetical protein
LLACFALIHQNGAERLEWSMLQLQVAIAASVPESAYADFDRLADTSNSNTTRLLVLHPWKWQGPDWRISGNNDGKCNCLNVPDLMPVPDNSVLRFVGAF